MAASDDRPPPHILVFPFPAQGHMIPLLDLAHHLAARGLSITVLVTPKNLFLLDQILARCPSIQTLVLPFPPYPTIPPGVENCKDLPPNSFKSMIHAMGSLHDPILQWARSCPCPPDAIVSDFFLGWTQYLASELGIPRSVFCPSGAVTLANVNCLWREMPVRDDHSNPYFPVPFSKLPKSPTFPWYQLSPIYRSYQQGDPVSEFIRDAFLANITSWGFVFNSFAELESPYLDYMKRDLGHPRVWAVGPLSSPDSAAVAARGGPTSVSAGDVMGWLDTCQDSSVLYVCFGSQAVLSRRQMESVAAALERSGVQFVWSVKVPTADGQGDAGVVPEGFEDRLSGRGLVIKGWAPQVPILEHAAVGSFLTHCGWNSVVEGLSAGVVLLAWPMGADQFLNARLLVEEAGVAVKVCEGRDSVPDPEELSRVIAELGEATIPQREKASQLRKAALDAVREGGRSYLAIQGLVEELGKLKLGKEVRK